MIALGGVMGITAAMLAAVLYFWGQPVLRERELLPERLLDSASPHFHFCWWDEGTTLLSGRLHKLLPISRLLATVYPDRWARRLGDAPAFTLVVSAQTRQHCDHRDYCAHLAPSRRKCRARPSFPEGDRGHRAAGFDPVRQIA